MDPHVLLLVVETCVTCSKNGSITGNILTDVLRHLDAHLNFDHEEATQFLLYLTAMEADSAFHFSIMVQMREPMLHMEQISGGLLLETLPSKMGR
jgi:hypothetical protein